jgi:hypothetical protein
MPLFIPTSNLLDRPSLAEQYVQVGELYNLDDNKKIKFQFNPQEYEFGKTYNWAAIDSIGAPSARYHYLGQKDDMFELQLLFIADLGMPPVVLEGIPNSLITPDEVVVDFDELFKELQLWNDERPAEGRPSYMRIIIGTDTIEGVITNMRKRVLDQFSNLKTRRGQITIQVQPCEVEV